VQPERNEVERPDVSLPLTPPGHNYSTLCHPGRSVAEGSAVRLAAASNPSDAQLILGP
jgi:hypothetical protein